MRRPIPVGSDFPVPKRGKFEAHGCEIGPSSSASTSWVVKFGGFPCIFLDNQGFYWRWCMNRGPKVINSGPIGEAWGCWATLPA